ncbi:MAG: lipid-A-disaccharide synthase N-terminal domain-containing protein [Patescibacteria group bacterium]
MADFINLLNFWTLFGFFGQVLFFLRFLAQWIHSERVGRSEIPVYFWYFSIAGGIIILIYSFHIKDLVFIIGQSLALVIYVRNVVLIKKESRQTASEIFER